jgi:alcohol dehydrogenase
MAAQILSSNSCWVTHRFAMNDIMKAYDTFGNAADDGALKVLLKNDGSR